jgi:hypothetical protein
MIIIKSKPDFDFIKYCFSKDKDLLDKYHIAAGQGLDICASNTFNLLHDNNVEMFKIFDYNDNIVGFFGKEKHNVLTGFFIAPEFRGSSDIWNKILENFSMPVRTAFYLKNTRAIKALNKQGFRIKQLIDTDLGKAVLMEN